jgi:Fur family ferric uptake transcriptional regulator
VLQPLPVAQTPENKFREYLASRPKPQRFTEAQRRMLRHVFASHTHFDAEELCSNLDKAKQNVSRATVYRTLAKLVDAGLLRQIHLGQRVVYEHDYGYPEHAHLHCERCGKMIEFARPELEEIVAEICRKNQFQMRSFNLVVQGTCVDCNRKRFSQRRLDLI